MTDNEIVKALECCKTNEAKMNLDECENCPYDGDCHTRFIHDVLSFINRKKAEIERLNKEVDRLSQLVLYHDVDVADAIKEFAERLKEKACVIAVSHKGETIPEMTEYHIGEVEINNLVKEMVGDSND